jgi:hypothetical protein
MDRNTFQFTEPFNFSSILPFDQAEDSDEEQSHNDANMNLLLHDGESKGGKGSKEEKKRRSSKACELVNGKGIESFNVKSYSSHGECSSTSKSRR